MHLSPCKFWHRLAWHALWLHGVWEVVQCRLFYDMGASSLAFGSAFMVGATLADVALSLFLIVLALRLTRQHSANSSCFLLLLALCGGGMAILLELLATTLGWWRYSPAMPAIAVFGKSIGLVPVLQMALLPDLALLLARFPFTFGRK